VVPAALTLLVVLLVPRLSFAQQPTPVPPSDVQPPAPNRVEGPGPYVIDVRGTTMRVPQTSDFYPDIPGETIIPARGFGLESGVHMYPLRIGTRRIGFGVEAVLMRGTATTPPSTATTTDDNGGSTSTTETFPDVTVTTRIVSPQVSINFGTSRGWSYLSTGAGPARVKATAGSEEVVTSKLSVNAGAGARWFITSHVGVGFDLRAHWVGSRALFAASAGFSLK
jgi:hypothetical protein